MKTKILILPLVLALILAAAGVALANNGFERRRWVLGGGASDSAAGGTALRATLGQPVVGVVTSGGGDVTLGQGFWCGGAVAIEYQLYLPLTLRNY